MSRNNSFRPEELIQIKNKIEELRRNGGDSAETTKAIREILQQWRQQLKTREEDNEDDDENKHDLWSDENLLNENDQKLLQEICRKYSNSEYSPVFWNERGVSEEEVRRILLKTLEQLREGLSKAQSEMETNNETKEQDEKEEP